MSNQGRRRRTTNEASARCWLVTHSIKVGVGGNPQSSCWVSELVKGKLNFSETFWLKSEIYYLCLIYLFAQFRFILRINLLVVHFFWIRSISSPEDRRKDSLCNKLIVIFWLWVLETFQRVPSQRPREYSIRVISESYRSHLPRTFGQIKNPQTNIRR